MADRTVGGTLRSLLLACLNATLILVLLCLVAGWMLLREVRGVTDDIASAATELTAVRDEVAELRADIAALQEAAPGAREARLDALRADLQPAVARLQAVEIDPDALIDRAIDRSAAALKQGVAELRGCVPVQVSGSSSQG